MFDLIQAQSIRSVAPTRLPGASVSSRACRSRRAQAVGRAHRASSAQRTLDERALHDLESALLTADVGVAATGAPSRRHEGALPAVGTRCRPRAILRASLSALLAGRSRAPLRVSDARPFVIMLAGVNGAGKTTSIGKLAKWFAAQGLAVLLAAGDTFSRRRARAARRLGRAQRRRGGPAAQAAISAARDVRRRSTPPRARDIDVVLADTAGRSADAGAS